VQKTNLFVAANNAKLFEYINIGQLNGNTLSVLQAENRTLDFHVHEKSDELFYVLEGQFVLEFNKSAVTLAAGDLIIVPKGTRHRPVVTTRVKCLLMDMNGTLNAENTGGTYAIT